MFLFCLSFVSNCKGTKKTGIVDFFLYFCTLFSLPRNVWGAIKMVINKRL